MRDNRGDEEKEEGEREGGGVERGRRAEKGRKEEERKKICLKNVLPWQLLSIPCSSPSLPPFLYPSSSSSYRPPDLSVP